MPTTKNRLRMAKAPLIGNRFLEGLYGIKGAGAAAGLESLTKYAPGFEWRDNVLVRTTLTNKIAYPPGTTIA